MVSPLARTIDGRLRTCRSTGASPAPVSGSTLEAVPFRQIFTFLLALIAILLAALVVLSWDGGDDDTATPSDTTAPVDDASTTTTSSTTTTTIVPTSTSVPVDCGTDPETGETTTTTEPATTTEAGTDEADAEGEPEPEPATGPTLGQNSSLSTVGLDTVTFGLTVTQAEAASGHEMVACAPVSDCYRVTPTGAPAGISFVVDEGTIERVDIVDDSPITTLSGAGIGTTAAELDELFGDQLEQVDLGGGRTDVIFVPSDENDQEFRVAFTLLDGVVETLRSGRVPLVLEAEPCA